MRTRSLRWGWTAASLALAFVAAARAGEPLQFGQGGFDFATDMQTVDKVTFKEFGLIVFVAPDFGAVEDGTKIQLACDARYVRMEREPEGETIPGLKKMKIETEIVDPEGGETVELGSLRGRFKKMGQDEEGADVFGLKHPLGFDVTAFFESKERAETIIRIVRSFKGKTGVGDSTATSCNVYVDRGSKEAARAQRAQARALDGLARAAAREVLERRSREN